MNQIAGIAAGIATPPNPTVFKSPDGWIYDSKLKVISSPDGRKYQYGGAGLPSASELDQVKKLHAALPSNPAAEERLAKLMPALGASKSVPITTQGKAFVRPPAITGMGIAELANQLTNTIAAPMRAAGRALGPSFLPDWMKELPGNMAAGLITSPVDLFADAAVATDPKSTPKQTKKALANLVLKSGLPMGGLSAGFKAVRTAKQLGKDSKAIADDFVNAFNSAAPKAAKVVPGGQNAPAGAMAGMGAKPVGDVLKGFAPKAAPRRGVSDDVQTPGGASKRNVEAKEPAKQPTSIALRESDRYNMRPDEPDPQTVSDWADNARKAGHGTPEGTRAILDKVKAGKEPSAEETIGLSTRLADLHRGMRGLNRKSPEYKALFDEATEIRNVRHTETARALASRAVLMETDYSPEGIIASLETRTGKAFDPKKAAEYEKMATDYQAAKEKIGTLEKELEIARKEPDTSAKAGGSVWGKVWGKGSPVQRIDAAKKELADILGKMSANVDPSIIRPIAKLVKAHIDKAAGNIDLALKNAKAELKVGFGIEHSTDELWDAFKGVRGKRNVTEDLIRQRRETNRIAAAIRNKIADDERTLGGKIARKAAQASTEIKMWNPVARAIDQASNLDEVISTSFSSQFERPIANLVLKLSKSDARYKMVGLHERSEMVGRYIAEVKSDIREAAGLAEGRWQGGGPAGHFAGILDAPARAWHEITWAGERASHLSKKFGKFGEILDQIRDPELPGPLGRNEALKLHRDMKDYGDVQMLTNANWASRVRGMSHGYVNNFVPEVAKPFAHFLVDITTQFSKVLVNVADKTAQYSSPLYAAGRAAMELLPMKSAVSAEVRAKTFAQIVRRGGIGAGLTQLGYWMYEEGVKVPEMLGPAIVETRAKDGDRTGQYYQDDGYLAQIGRMSAALMYGYRQAQIDKSDIGEKQKEKLKKDLLFAPITDNPVASNMGRWAKLFDSHNPQPEQTLYSWLAGLYWPGGLNEAAKIQDKQEGVFGRRAEGFIQEVQKRTPTVGQNPKKLPSKTASVRR